MQHAPLKASALLISILLAACGGGGGDSGPTPNSTAQVTNAGTTGTSGTTGTTGSSTTAGSTGTSTSSLFVAQVTAAPAEGASISNVVHFEIHGNGIENAELLPPTGYAPVLGRFTISADKTMGTLDFDTTSLPNGTLQLRISAYNQPAGSTGGSEIVAMPTRHWTLANTPPYAMNPPPPDPTSIPNASYMPQVLLASGRLPYVDPQALNDLWAMDTSTFNAYVANNWPQFNSTMRRYVPANVEFDFPTPNGLYSAWSSCFSQQNATACHESLLYIRNIMLGKQPQT